MKSSSIAAIGLALATLQAAAPASAAQTIVKPTSDGTVFACDGCNGVSEGAYVTLTSTGQGEIKFSMAELHARQSEVLLAINPYGEPLWGKHVDVYGTGTSTPQLVNADVDTGTFLGTLVLPDGLGFGQDATFDVTNFINGVHAPYVAFNLRSDGLDLFSSIEYNYGHPSELLATAAAVPEPANASLMLAGLMATASLAWRRRRAS